MSYLNTKQALLTQLLTVVDSSDVAFENKKFEPAGKSVWYAAYFRPATEESTGKTLASSDQQYGFFQVSVFTPRDTWGNDQLEKIDLIKSAFPNTSSISYSGQNVDILETTVNEGRVSESWFQRDLTINYMSFSER